MKKSASPLRQKTVKSYVLRCLRHLLVMDSHWVTKCKSMAQTRVKRKIRQWCEICLFEIFPHREQGALRPWKTRCLYIISWVDLSKVPFGSLWILPPKLKVPFGSLWILPPKLKNSNWHQVQLSWFPLNFWRITDDDFHDFHETNDWPYFKWNIIVISGSLCLWKGFEAEPCLCVWFLFLLLLVVFAWTGCVAYVHSWRHLPDRSAGIQDWRVKPYWNWVVKSLIWICLRPGLVMTRTQVCAVEVTVIVRHWDVKGSVQHCHYEHSFFCCFCPMAQVEKVDLFDSLSQSLSFVVVLNHGCCWLHFWCGSCWSWFRGGGCWLQFWWWFWPNCSL